MTVWPLDVEASAALVSVPHRPDMHYFIYFPNLSVIKSIFVPLKRGHAAVGDLRAALLLFFFPFFFFFSLKNDATAELNGFCSGCGTLLRGIAFCFSLPVTFQHLLTRGGDAAAALRGIISDRTGAQSLGWGGGC